MKSTLVFSLSFLLLAAAPLSGGEILARAGSATGLTSYSVPVHFDVHMHRPIGISTGVEGIVYFKAPARAALVITKIPSIIGKFFKGSYSLDLSPQTWPAKYTVTLVSQAQSQGTAVYALQSVPKADPSVDHVVFTVTQADYSPVSVVWSYRDGSSISVTMQCQRLSGNALPQTESIAVNMPQFGLDAKAQYGSYSLNGPVPDSVFANH
jgi:hypothetical protein